MIVKQALMCSYQPKDNNSMKRHLNDNIMPANFTYNLITHNKYSWEGLIILNRQSNDCLASHILQHYSFKKVMDWWTTLKRHHACKFHSSPMRNKNSWRSSWQALLLVDQHKRSTLIGWLLTYIKCLLHTFELAHGHTHPPTDKPSSKPPFGWQQMVLNI